MLWCACGTAREYVWWSTRSSVHDTYKKKRPPKAKSRETTYRDSTVVIKHTGTVMKKEKDSPASSRRMCCLCGSSERPDSCQQEPAEEGRQKYVCRSLLSQLVEPVSNYLYHRNLSGRSKESAFEGCYGYGRVAFNNFSRGSCKERGLGLGLGF